MCVCVCFGGNCDIFPSLSIPFVGQQTCVTSLSCLSVLPQVRFASLLQRVSGGATVGLLTHLSTHALNAPHSYREASLIKYMFLKPKLQTPHEVADRQPHLGELHV